MKKEFRLQMKITTISNYLERSYRDFEANQFKTHSLILKRHFYSYDN